jgi:hypothetical protein
MGTKFTVDHIRPRKRKIARPEQDLQASLCRFLDRTLPGDCFYFACPNGGWRSPIEAAILKGQGVKAGVPDLIFAYQGKMFALEMKSEVGRLSLSQRGVHDRLRNAGVRVEVARSFHEAIERLREFGIPVAGRLAA